MSATCKLKSNPFGGTVGDESTFSLEFVISGTDVYEEAKDSLIREAPSRVGVMYPRTYTVGSKDGADDVWEGKVEYTYGKPQTDPTFTIEINTATAKFTTSLQTIQGYGALPIPDYKGSIGVTKDSVEGVDAMVPAITWMESHPVPASRVTDDYVKMLFVLTARMNASQFRIFAPGEALFLGVTLKQSSERDAWDGQFKWVGSPNAENFQVGGITIAEKLGHDYLWIRYTEDESNGATVKVPKHVFIERIYQFGEMDNIRLDDPR